MSKFIFFGFGSKSKLSELRFGLKFFRAEILNRIWLTLLGSISLKELVLNLEYFPLKSLEDNMDMMSTDLVGILVYQSYLGILVQTLLGPLVAGLLNPEGLHLESFELTLPSFDVVLCEISLDGFETKPKIWLLNGKSEKWSYEIFIWGQGSVKTDIFRLKPIV